LGTSITDLLTSSDAKEFKAMIDDFAMGTSNLRRMPYEGSDSLWVYGPISEKAFLVLITPYEEILALAGEGKKYVGSLISNMVRFQTMVSRQLYSWPRLGVFSGNVFPCPAASLRLSPTLIAN
jgi:hypothetical protein